MAENNTTVEHGNAKETIKYLQNAVFYKGFGKELFPAIKDSINQGLPAFKPEYIKQDQQITYSLDFKRSQRKDSDLYFWDGFQATSKQYPERSLYFEIRQGKGFTAKEAANRLMGMAVCKEIKNAANVKNEVWFQTDFTQKDDKGNFIENRYYNNHGFDLKKALEGSTIVRNEKNEIPDWMAHALKKGDIIPQALVVVNGETMPCYLAANPKERAVDVFDEKANLIAQFKGLSEKQQEKQQASPEDLQKRNDTLQSIRERIAPKPIVAPSPSNENSRGRGKKR